MRVKAYSTSTWLSGAVSRLATGGPSALSNNWSPEPRMLWGGALPLVLSPLPAALERLPAKAPPKPFPFASGKASAAFRQDQSGSRSRGGGVRYRDADDGAVSWRQQPAAKNGQLSAVTFGVPPAG
jgi:hypothetical protein